MSTQDSRLYEMVRTQALQNGIDNAISEYRDFNFISEEQAERFRSVYQRGIKRIARGGPVMKTASADEWYPGASDNDPSWAYFKHVMTEKGKEEQIPSNHASSDVIVGLTPDPAKEARASKGLVVGFVQSGKTTNFISVAAKLADRGYRMVIVLAGIHNALRYQTQKRLEEYLIPDNSGRWVPLTSQENDFDLVKLKDEKKRVKQLNASALLRSPGKTNLLVVKKNHVVLTKLRNWLSDPAAVEALKEEMVLVIDDEADQASVATATINPLIRDILALMPRSTYIGYTATPFANIFIDPNAGNDLYPRDFIYPLPRPEGYFGPEKLFGRDVLDGGDDIEGFDMVRIVSEEDESKYRPLNKREVSEFRPEMTDELRSAISWFFLATAARWLREGPVDSSMLIHTSLQIEVHEAYMEILSDEKDLLLSEVTAGDSARISQLKAQWEEETTRVPASHWDRTAEEFEELLEILPEVIEDCRIIIDNSKSEERIDYDSRPHNTIIAVGGNTLSRGITLEGLVSSLFMRPTTTYDTLMQMGRWFGFRPGYEDLPRIWTTDFLRHSFRYLSLVEHEMRIDMQLYEMEGMTPMDAAVRIRTHPSLRITAKMGAAQPVATSYNGARLQVRQYRRDLETLKSNWQAGLELIESAKQFSLPEGLDKNGDGTVDETGSVLYRDIPVDIVQEFLGQYHIHSDQKDVDSDLILDYIDQRSNAGAPTLLKWNIAVRAGDKVNKEVDFAGHAIRKVNRSPLKDSIAGSSDDVLGPVADIGTLMVPQDLVMDIPGVSSTDSRKLREAGMKKLRNDTALVSDVGLLVLYPIAKESKPTTDAARLQRTRMGTHHDVLGLGIIFPENLGENDAIRSDFVAVDPNPTAEEVDYEFEIEGEDG